MLTPSKWNYKLSTVIPFGGWNNNGGPDIDWMDTEEWNCLHLAVRYDHNCLEVKNFENVISILVLLI